MRVSVILHSKRDEESVRGGRSGKERVKKGRRGGDGRYGGDKGEGGEGV